MHRTKAGLILEKILHENKHRHLLCWNGEDSDECFDCACCITWVDEPLWQQCGCSCHTHIEEMAQVPHVKLWLLALEAMDKLPKFFTSYAEKLTYSKKLIVEHAAVRADWTPKQMEILGPCQCEFCEFVRNDFNVRKFEIEGEDNSHIDADVRVSAPCPEGVKDTFEAWWSSTNNQNWFSNKPVTLEDLKETANYAWKAAGGR